MTLQPQVQAHAGRRPGALRLLAAVGTLLLACGCGNDKPSASAGTPNGAPATATAISTAATSSSTSASASTKAKPPPKPYTGPSGTVIGLVTAAGDAPALLSHKYPSGCEAAAATYGKAYRVGQDNQLADAIVSVTHYGGFVPAKQDHVDVTIQNCAYSSRSIAITDGQHLEVRNLDPLRSYIPHLDGARSPATIVAVPRGAAVKLYSRGRQRYWLRDQMGKSFMVAHVFHFPYSTTFVTELDGRYRIEGIPVGAAKVNIVIPIGDKHLKHMSKKVVIKEGDNTVDFTILFDLAKDMPSVVPNSSAVPSGSAVPNSSAAATPSTSAAVPAGSAAPSK